MRRERLAFQFRMELHPDEPGVVLDLDDFGEAAVGAHAGEDQAAVFQFLAVLDVHLIAVAVAFLDDGGAVDGSDVAARRQVGGVGAEAHGAALLV